MLWKPEEETELGMLKRLPRGPVRAGGQEFMVAPRLVDFLYQHGAPRWDLRWGATSCVSPGKWPRFPEITAFPYAALVLNE